MTGRPTSVVLVTTALRHGGAEHQVVLLACRLAERGRDVRVVSMRPPEAHLGRLDAAGVPVVSLDMPRQVPDPRGVLRLARLLRRWRPDIVHSHMVHANLLTRVTRLFAPVPVLVSTAHNIVEGPRWREWAYRLTEPLCDLTTNVSAAAVERYVSVGAATAGKIRHVPNGIELTRFVSDPAARARVREEVEAGQRPVLVAVGRFEPAKDHANLLEALRRVVGQRPDVLLVLVGHGSLEAEVRARVGVLGLGHNVRFLGTREDVPAVMNAADMYVMSSAWEGLPLVLLEASAIGMPVVATAVGGNAEVVHPEMNGLLVPPADPEALAEAMLRVLSLPAHVHRQWGDAGRCIAARYSIDEVVDQWESIYRELHTQPGVSQGSERAGQMTTRMAGSSDEDEAAGR